VTEFDDIDALAAGFYGRGGQPGLVYGVVAGGELVHVGGLGERRLGGARPDAETVFRIASMTKSFTASAVLLLRDEGALALDDLAEGYVPELRGWPPVTPDAARVTVRHLLTMTAGFPTDDPWGDRQQGLPLDDFAKFLADGVSFAWAPGTRFEYSNLGYAILGRIVTAASGVPYQDFIRERLMLPLGMTRSGYEADVTDEDGLASGYRRAPDGWEHVPLEPYGAFAPMGGVFTCVRDLARWVAGFAAAFPPGEAVSAHPVRAASRREMQLPQVLTGWDRPSSFPADGTVSAYGFGLGIAQDPVLGRLVGHGGGYPGFGSFMRWHPATGTGVIAFGNSTYARMHLLTMEMMTTVVRKRGYAISATPALAPGQAPWPETIAARDAVTRLLTAVDWDDLAADRLFTPNVAQDVPYPERRQAIALIRERIGPLSGERIGPLSGEPGQALSGEHSQASKLAPEYDTPAHCRWWLAGQHGTVQVQILLSPQRPPRVQSLTVAVPPAPGSPLQEALDSVLAWMNGTGPAPTLAPAPAPGSPVPGLATAGSASAGAAAADGQLARRLKAAAVWAGECRTGAYKAGDGTASATVELVGEHAALTLSVTIDPVTGRLVQADITH
jgi:CubicO group peptidase (beta-lactamase class C family)